MVATLIAAFRDDPAVRSLYPTDLEYVRYFPGFLLAFGGRAFDAGTVDQDADGHAAALWFPPGIEPDGDAIMRHLEVSIPKKRLAPLAAGMEMQASPPSDRAALVPALDGRRTRSAGHGHWRPRFSARASPAPTPTASRSISRRRRRRSAAFYARHGFETKATISLPDYPEIVTMWRPAR